MEYVIWSNEHGAFWGPGRRGYVPRLADAGRYSRAQADEILASAWCPGFEECCDRGRIPHEVALQVVAASATGDVSAPGDTEKLAEARPAIPMHRDVSAPGELPLCSCGEPGCLLR